MPAGLTVHLRRGVGLGARVWGRVGQCAAGEQGGLLRPCLRWAAAGRPGPEAPGAASVHVSSLPPSGPFSAPSHLGVPSSCGWEPWAPAQHPRRPTGRVGASDQCPRCQRSQPLTGSLPSWGAEACSSLPEPTEAPTSRKRGVEGPGRVQGACPTRGRCGPGQEPARLGPGLFSSRRFCFISGSSKRTD